MKSEKSAFKKEEEPKYQAPKLKGSIRLRAAKGKVLPVRYGVGLARITEKKEGHELNWESLPYDSKCMIHRALKAKDIELLK